MINKYHLNEEYVRASINKGLKLLKGGNISNSTKKEIKADIKFFKNVLSDNCNLYYTITKQNTNYSFDKIKNIVLKEMKRHYKIFGTKLMDWVIFLNNENIFQFKYNYIKYNYSQTELSMEQQEELTIKNYELNSKKLLRYAKDIFSPKPTRQIHEIDDGESFCRYSIINGISFLIVDPTESPSTLNHEIQHGIEDILNINKSDIYTELGTIFYEILFTNTLYSYQGYINSYDFQDRIEEIDFLLPSITKYFEIIKEFATMDFKPSSKEFKNIFISKFDIPEIYLNNYLIENFITNEMDASLQYLLSYLKAIELYNQQKTYHNDSFDILKPYISTRKFNFNIPKDASNLYNAYIEEMNQKTKKLI